MMCHVVSFLVVVVVVVVVVVGWRQPAGAVFFASGGLGVAGVVGAQKGRPRKRKIPTPASAIHSGDHSAGMRHMANGMGQ